MNPIRIILVEDNPEYRRVIKRALDLSSGMELVAKYGTAEQALREIDKSPELRQSEVLLLDLNLPKASGLEALPWFQKASPETRIIVLTQSDEPEDILAAIRLGASGYLLKSSSVSQIRESIISVTQGGAPLDHQVANLILNTLKKNLNQPSEDSTLLSDRERDVLVLLGEGLVKKEIAEKLSISSHTVATHVRHIYEKLGVFNAPSAISAAYRKGLLPLNEDPEDEQ
jgi:two-component system, NarL family, nitrate/nitrite response regulator NarL